MNSNQANLIQELRFKLGSRLDKSYDDKNGFNLQRWLNTYDNDIEKIVPKLLETLEFRRALKLGELSDCIDNGEFRKMFNKDMIKYFPGGPGGVCGYDKSGNVVYIQPVGLTDPKDALPLVRYSEFLTWVTLEVERVFRMVLKKEEELNVKCGVVVIADVKDLAMQHLSFDAISICLAVIWVLQQHSPDLMTRMYLINAPFLWNVVMRLLSPFVTNYNRTKLEILSGNDEKWKKKLRDTINPDTLPIHWGGTKTGAFGNHGDVTTWKIPPNLTAHHPSYPKTSLTQLLVDRSSIAYVSFDIKTTSTVTWYFACSSGGIVFGIRKVSEKADSIKQWVKPKWFIHTDHVPEYGECEFLSGSYELVFDNTSSRLWSRKIAYQIKIKSIDF